MAAINSSFKVGMVERGGGGGKGAVGVVQLRKVSGKMFVVFVLTQRRFTLLASSKISEAALHYFWETILQGMHARCILQFSVKSVTAVPPPQHDRPL